MNTNEHDYIVSVNRLQTYIDSISKILSNMDDLVLESNEYFSGSLADSFNSKYSQFQMNHKRIIENLNHLKSEYMNRGNK